MANIYFRNSDESEHEAVNNEHPFPVEVFGDSQPPVSGRTITRRVQVPGIGAAAVYQDKDAFGTLIVFRDVFRPEQMSGTVVKALLYDLDDEGIGVDVPLFTRPVTPTADNSPLALSDADNLACAGVISIASFSDFANNQLGQSTGDPIWIKGESVDLYTQLQIRGAPTIAAGSEPWISITVVPD